MFEKYTLAAAAALLQHPTSRTEGVQAAVPTCAAQQQQQQAAEAVSSSQHQQADVRSNLRSSILAVQATPPQREYRPSFFVVLSAREGIGAAKITAGAWRQGFARLQQQQRPQAVVAALA